ncbi:MAG: hypothetical protein WBD31_30550 [Rubripirellula sp.]
MLEREPDIRLDQESVDRVRAALELIHQAQLLINHAAQELCPVSGFADEWSKSAEVHDLVKSYWHEVNSRLIEILRANDVC